MIFVAELCVLRTFGGVDFSLIFICAQSVLNFFGTDCAQVFNSSWCLNVRNAHGSGGSSEIFHQEHCVINQPLRARTRAVHGNILEVKKAAFGHQRRLRTSLISVLTRPEKKQCLEVLKGALVFLSEFALKVESGICNRGHGHRQ